MTSNSYASHEWDIDHVCDEHDYRCWNCGQQKVDRSGALPVLAANIAILLMLAIMVTPLVWLVRVTWSWAL